MHFRLHGEPVENMLSSETYSICMNELRSCLQNKRYDLVITGTIGSGKSTLCDIILKLVSSIDHVKVNTFPEFISFDRSFSEQMLDWKIRGNISQLTFQSYILDTWDQLLKNTDTSNTFNIYERCADDSVVCFCNIANKNDLLTDNELLVLYDRLMKLNKQYSNISFFDEDIHFIELTEQNIDSIIITVTKIICSDMANNISKRVIGLSISPEESMERIKIRARESEFGYSKSTIELYQSHYKKLFKHLSKYRCISKLLELGKLI